MVLSLGLAAPAFAGGTAGMDNQKPAQPAPKVKKVRKQKDEAQEKSEKAAFKEHLKREREVCRAHPNRAACRNLKERQKAEKRNFKQQEERAEKKDFKRDPKRPKSKTKAQGK